MIYSILVIIAWIIVSIVAAYDPDWKYENPACRICRECGMEQNLIEEGTIAVDLLGDHRVVIKKYWENMGSHSHTCSKG